MLAYPILFSLRRHRLGSRWFSTRFDYKQYPVDSNDPAFGGTQTAWRPILGVQLIVGHSPPSHRFEALVDSGAVCTLFHASVGTRLGLRLKEGKEGSLRGVIKGVVGIVYYHQVKIKIVDAIIPIWAGFYEELSLAAILGRQGFFEHYRVTFDPSNTPPGLEIQRIGRS